MSAGVQIHGSSGTPRLPAAIRRPQVVVRPRRRHDYDWWIGPIVIAAVLAFCIFASVVGATLVQHALTR